MLVTDGGTGQGRSAVAAVRSLDAGGYKAMVTVTGRRSVAAASRACALALPAPAADAPGYAARVTEIVEEHGVATVLPASDASLIALGHPGATLVDKERLSVRAAAAGLPTPTTMVMAGPGDLAAAVGAGDVTLPAIVKPSVSRWPAVLVQHVQSAATLPADGPLLVQPFLHGTMRAVAGVIDDGEVLAVAQQRYLRRWPVDCGTASAAVTEEVDEGLLARLADLLQGHHGIFQAQLIEGTLLDVNPRVYGSMSLATAAGANLARVWCDAQQGHRPPARATARAGVRYRWLEGDVRHLLHRTQRGDLGLREALDAVVPRRGTAHSIESLRDPGPLFTRARYAVERRP